MKIENSNEWLKAVREEMVSLHKNETWVLIDRPSGQKVLGCKWVCKIKECIPKVENLRFKVRLVAKGLCTK